MPYVYLVQPVELVGTNRYKIGMSSLNNLSRLRSYKVGTRYITMFDCEDAYTVERSLIAAFNKYFKRIGGNEYFEILNELEALELFFTTVNNHLTCGLDRTAAPLVQADDSLREMTIQTRVKRPAERTPAQEQDIETDWMKQFVFVRTSEASDKKK